MNDYTPPPSDLGPHGSQLWDRIVNDEDGWDLRPDEIETLHAACRVRDTVAVLTTALVDEPLTVKGSMGQKVINPILAERRFQERTMADLLQKLKLGDVIEFETTTVINNGKMTRSEAGRKAANARWDRARGRS